jgi:hypothetical protein
MLFTIEEEFGFVLLVYFRTLYILSDATFGRSATRFLGRAIAHRRKLDFIRPFGWARRHPAR